MQDRIQVLQTDITTLAVDAIVNAANSSLLGGCKTGQAKLTKGYRLPARFILHTVGPVWNRGTRNEPELLASCYRTCFALAREHNLRTLAFPAISCGIYGYPIPLAVQIALRETLAELAANPDLEKVIFACFDNAVYGSYQRAIANALAGESPALE